MNLDFFKLKSIFLEDTVVRNPRVGSKNRPTSRTIDVGCTGINSTDDIYTGEIGVNSEYLIQGSVKGTVIKGSSGTFTLNSNKIKNIQNVYGLLPGETVNWGDSLRADGHDEFYPVTGISDDFSTLWLQDNNTTVTGVNDFEVRKIRLDSTHFEYIKNDEGDIKFFYDKNNRDWRYTGIQGFTGPLIAESGKDAFIEGDPVTLQFYPSYTSTAPDVTSIDTTSTDPKAPYGQKVLENKLISDTSDLILNPIPYPDDNQNFRLYWGPVGDVSLKTKDIDYTINYTMDPDYTSAKLPYSQRTVAYLKFLNELKNTVQVSSIGLDFQGVFNIHEDPSTSATKLARGVINIFPNSKALTIAGDTQEYTGEIIRVGQKVLDKYFDYNIEYNNGIINFIKHSNLELDVSSVLYNQNLIWDGVSVVKGVGLTGLKTQDPANLVIPYGIAGLTGINVDVYFEDIDDNDFKEGVDYTFEYQSGAIKLTKPLKSGECALVSYFVEGEDVVNEVLNLKTLRTQKNPIIESSITIKKTYSDSSSSSTGIKILIEGVDYKVFYLSGTIVLLNPSVTENLSSLQVSYTPFSQVQCILQPVASDPNNYLITIVDDKLKVSDPFNLKFSVINPIISTPQVDPFGENPTTYANSVIPKSLLSLKAEGEPGYGLSNLTPDEMIAIGITGLHYMGLDVKLGQTPEEFYAIGLTGIIELGIAPDMKQIYDVTNYTYNDVSKIVALDPSKNVGKPRPDLNDIILATYSYVGDVLPYTPVQIIFPVFNQDDNSILIEGFDKTDTIYPGMILRIDNFDPQKYYYFKVVNVDYDGMNTTITFASPFPEDIRNPSFYIFDDILNWYPLPAGTSIDSTVTVGADTLTLSGDPLEAKDLLRPQTLMSIGGTDIYEVLSTSAIDSNTLQVKIFPNLQKEYPTGIMISDPVYQQGATDIVSKHPIITDPPHPAFTIRYVAPVDAIYGMATIYIDGEKIVFVEIVDNSTAAYNFYFRDYASIRDLADAIVNTVSHITPRPHSPFTLISENGDIEQYYIGAGFWSSNLVLPFDHDQPIIIPNEGYLVTIKQEVFRYILVKAYNNTSNFLVEKKDRKDYFSAGNLLAFISKSSGDLSFFEVSGVSTVPNKTTPKTADTQVSLNDSFRENMIAPYMYKYDAINWVEVTSPFFNIDTAGSKISLSSDLPLFKQNSFVRINGGLVYQIQNVSVYDTVTTLTFSPGLSSSINKITSFKVSDMPIYLNSVSPQPSIFINYKVYEGRSGETSVTVDDKNITITEKLAGSLESTAQIELARYSNLNQIAGALNRLQLTVPGYNPLSVDTSAYKDVFSAGGNSLLLVPMTQAVSLPASISVSKKIFEIGYTSPDSSTDYKITIPSDGSNTISLSEWKGSDKPGTLRVNTVNYSNRLISEVISDISNLGSIVSGHKPWSVSNTNYDDYFAKNKPGYYTIIPFPGSDKDSLPYFVQAIENPKFWYQVGVLNRNVLVQGTDYTIDGTQIALTIPIAVSERYEVSYLGIDDLAEYGGKSITCSCRYFYSIPAGYQVNVYMDYLNPDQYYVQKLTERKFLEIVTQPQIKDLLQQAGNSVGMGNDSGSDNSANNWDGGLVDLYYYLKDEKIKSQLYIKLFQWYKQRLRNFAAEAQLIMGVKYGHCNFYGIKGNGQYTLEDSYVEDNNYTLTKISDLAQIHNGFSKFFPIGYDGNAPQPYARFGNIYQSYNEVFCYNIRYIDESGKILNTEGRVISTNPYWSNVVDKQTTFSNLDFDILPYDQESSFVSRGVTGLYTIPYNQEDKHLRVSDSNYKFLERISTGDQLQILDSKNTYNIASILSNASAQPVIITYSDGTPLTYDGTMKSPGTLPVYGEYLQNYSYVLSTDTVPPTTNPTNPLGYPVGTPVVRNTSSNIITGLGYRLVNPSSPYDILVLENGKYFTDSGIRTFTVQRSVVNNVTTWNYVSNKANWTLQDLEANLPKDGLNIIVTRNSSKDFPVIFPAWDDEFNLGTKVVGLRIINQKTNTDIIKKPFSFTDLFGLDDEDKFFTVYEGTYDELTGLYKILNTVNINLKYLTFFEERRVNQVLDAIKYNLTGTKYPLPFPPYILKLSNIYKKKDNLGTEKFFYVDFDKYYDATANNGYNESIIFRSRNRNSWVQYAVNEDNDFVDPEYGFSDADVYKNFYDPNNLYIKLIIERQSWLTELNVIKDIFDTNDKLDRAYTFSNGVIQAQAEFLDYLNQISCGDNSTPLPSCIKYRIESYSEILNFLLDQSDTTHQYLVDNTSGPLYRTMMEDTNISKPMNDSYTQAQTAFTKYTNFQNECNLYYDLNSFYYNKWQTEYVKWVLSLEQGLIYQKDAKNIFQASLDNYIDIGFKTFPAIKLSVIDQGVKPAFTISVAKYVVTYNMLATADTAQDEYDDATLIIQYKISDVKDNQEIPFNLRSYSTLQNLVDSINSTCVHPVSNIKVLSASCVFDYYPYRNYSTKWILRTYRATPSNDSNGPDTVGGDGWTALSPDPTIDDRIYVSNVLDHRNYDSRVFFMSRTDIHKDILTINSEKIIAFPYYVDTRGNDILSKMGPIPVAGRWATEDASSTDSVDYTKELDVLSIKPGVDNATIIDYEFLDYVQGEEQISGEQTPRNPTYETSPETLASIGYNPQTFTLSENTPIIVEDAVTGTSSVLDANLQALNTLVANVPTIAPTTKVIRDLRIILRIKNQVNPDKYQDVSFVFSLRQYPTINDLNNALNNNHYASDGNGNIILDENNNAAVASIGKRAIYFNSSLIGSEDLQGRMKTVDITTEYNQQLIYVATYEYWQINDERVYNTLTNSWSGDITTIKIIEPINSSYNVGWKLRKQNAINGMQITFRVTPRTYSPYYDYRFKIYDPKKARDTIFLNEKKDTLAFDLYGWDDDAQYKIKNNVLYLRSATITDPVQILLYKTSNLDTSIDHPEEKLQLIDVIRSINNNATCNNYFFANLRFGREYNSDYDYTYLPDTQIWAGGDGWVSIQDTTTSIIPTKVALDYLYLDKDIAFSISSVGSNPTYQVVPLNPLPPIPDPNIVYKSQALILSADMPAFEVDLNAIDFNSPSASYTVDSILSTLILTGNYITSTEVFSDFFYLTNPTIQDMVNAINLNPAFTASLYSAGVATIPSSNLVNGNNLSIATPTRLVASPSNIPVINLSVNTPEYVGVTYYVDNVLNKLTLKYIINTSHSFVYPITNLSTKTLYDVISEINTYSPIAGPTFFIATLKWINGFDSASLLLDATNVPITSTDILMTGIQEYPLMIGTNSIRIEDLISEINLTTYATGFSVTDLQSSTYIGYKGLPANLLVPVSGTHPFTDPLYFDFRNVIAAYILNMSHTTRSTVPGVISSAGESCTCTLSSDGTISFQKAVSSLTNSNFIGNTYSYNISNKDIAGFINAAMNLEGYLETPSPQFSYAIGKGILNMDVAIIPAQGISYGKLRLRNKSVDPNSDAASSVSSINLSLNDPEVLNTHVYFGFLGDISFYQISDYNLWKQYILVKRRVGLPWNKVNDSFIPDYYVSNDTYNFSSYDYTLNLVQNGKFLDYLKHVRFGQLANSLKLEDLYNNKYFWLYLKFHKEIGCDQKVIALTKKTKEDDQKAKLLT